MEKPEVGFGVGLSLDMGRLGAAACPEGCCGEAAVMPGHEARGHTGMGRTQPQPQCLSVAWSCAGGGDRKGPIPQCDDRDPSPPYCDLPA